MLQAKTNLFLVGMNYYLFLMQCLLQLSLLVLLFCYKLPENNIIT